MTTLEKMSRFSSVSSFDLYVAALFFSNLTGGPGSALPSSAATMRSTEEVSASPYFSSSRLMGMFFERMESRMSRADALEERGAADDRALLRVLHEEEVTLLVALLQGRVPRLEHLVAEREGVLLEDELANRDDVHVVARLLLERLELPVDGAGGGAGEEAAVVDDVPRGGSGGLEDLELGRRREIGGAEGERRRGAETDDRGGELAHGTARRLGGRNRGALDRGLDALSRGALRRLDC